MTAGLNVIVKVWRFSYPQDDVVGGAQPSGTVIYEGIRCRLQDSAPIAAFIMEGLQTKKIVQGVLVPGTLSVREYDQIEVTSPPNHHYFGERFRVDALQRENYHPADKRGVLLVTLTRATEHANQYQ